MSGTDRAPPAPPAPPAFLAARIALFFAASFLLVGTMMPYFPVWLDWKGLSAAEIAIVVATPMIVRTVFTPLISFAADRTGDVRGMLQFLAWGALVAVVALRFADGFWAILLISVVFALFWTTIMPLNEVIALDNVRNAGLDYGRVRPWGSLAFIVASWGGGYVIEGLGAEAIHPMLLVAALMVVAASMLLPRPQGKGRLKAATAGPAISLRDAASLVRQPLFIAFVLAGSFVQASHAVYYAFGTLHWQSLGISTGTVGALWMIGVLTEIGLFIWSRQVIAWFGPLRLVLIGGLGAILRWLATAQDPALGLLFPLQMLHALSFGASHLGAIYFISTAVPPRLASTAQGIYASFSGGLVIGLAMIASGPLYVGFAAGAFIAMAILALASVALCLWTMAQWRAGKRLSQAG